MSVSSSPSAWAIWLVIGVILAVCLGLIIWIIIVGLNREPPCIEVVESRES